MATHNLDGSNVARYQGRMSGSVDIDPATDNVRYGDTVMAVVLVDVASLHLDPVRGDNVGTYVLKVKDFAVVSDEVMQKQLYHHLPHLQPTHVPAMRVGLTGAREVVADGSGDTQSDGVVVIPPDTTVSTEQLSQDDIVTYDGDDGEMFNPQDESRERARLTSAARDPILRRFLNGE